MSKKTKLPDGCTKVEFDAVGLEKINICLEQICDVFLRHKVTPTEALAASVLVSIRLTSSLGEPKESLIQSIEGNWDTSAIDAISPTPSKDMN